MVATILSNIDLYESGQRQHHTDLTLEKTKKDQTELKFFCSYFEGCETVKLKKIMFLQLLYRSVIHYCQANY